MPRPTLPKPGFSLLRLHNTQSPHFITMLSSTAKTNLVDSIAQDIEGCIYAIGYYTNTGVLDADNTLQFDQVIRKIKREERHALRKMFRRVRTYRKKASKAKKGYKKIRKLIKKERNEQGQDHQQKEQAWNAVETELKLDVDSAVYSDHESPEQVSSPTDYEKCIVDKPLASNEIATNILAGKIAATLESLQNTQFTMV